MLEIRNVFFFVSYVKTKRMFKKVDPQSVKIKIALLLTNFVV